MKGSFKFLSIALLCSMFIIFSGCKSSINQELSNNSQEITQQKIKITPGELIGFKEDGVYTFRGIPYAIAERFKTPEKIISYGENPKMALTYGAVSPQSATVSNSSPSPYEFMTPSNGTADMVSNENCQYLNVWTNSLTGNKPVIVFFHGGGITSGASTELSGYTGKYFAKNQDIVFVSINHRLNALGFLDVSNYGGEEYQNSGLAGIEDCIIALEWIQDNIKEFGGNPKNVTIVGQSGGVQKVTTLASMSNTEHLFDKVVYISGYYNNSPKITGEENTKKLQEYLNVSDEELIPTLEKMSYDELIEATKNAECIWSINYGIGTFENPFVNDNGEINEYAAKRTWIIGTAYSEFNTNALSLITDGQNETNYLPNMTDEIVKRKLEELYGDRATIIIKEFQKAYPNHNISEVIYLNLNEDGGFTRYGLINEETGLLKKLNDAGSTVYNYVTAYKQPYFGGVTMYHSGDIPFWFYSIDEIDYMIKGDEKNAFKVSEEMSNALASFAKDGNPSTKNLEWKPYTKEEHNTMVFDTTSELKIDYDLDLYKTIFTK